MDVRLPRRIHHISYERVPLSLTTRKCISTVYYDLLHKLWVNVLLTKCICTIIKINGIWFDNLLYNAIFKHGVQMLFGATVCCGLND